MDSNLPFPKQPLLILWSMIQREGHKREGIKIREDMLMSKLNLLVFTLMWEFLLFAVITLNE